MFGVTLVLAQYRSDYSKVPLPTTHSRHGLGMAVAWHWLSETMPGKPRRLNADWQSLPLEETGNVLFVSGPLQTEVSYAEAAHLVEWIENGNVLVLMAVPDDENAQALYRSLGLPDAWAGEDGSFFADDSVPLVPASPNLILRDVRSLVAMPGSLPPQWSRVPLLEEEAFSPTPGEPAESLPYATQRTSGDGCVFLFSQSGIFCNGFLPQRDNWVLMLNLADLADAEDGQLIFDEYHLRSRRATSLFSRNGRIILILMAIQTLLVALIFVFARGKRFGPLVVPRNRAARSQLEYVSALADLYRRAGARHYCLARMYEALLRDLSSRLPGSRRPHDADLALAISNRSNLSLEQADRLLGDIHSTLAQKKIKRHQLMHLARRIAELRKEIRAS